MVIMMIVLTRMRMGQRTITGMAMITRRMKARS